jgi:16S rRNA (cytosine1402-N4)-methyltransferase
MEVVHVPVMVEEVLGLIDPKSSGVYLDATVGTGGHAEAILKAAPGCTLIGMDRDEEALSICRERLIGFGNVHLAKERFSRMREVMENAGFSAVDGILMDLGTSMMQLKRPERGFGFLSDAPLDMRMDVSQEFTAADIVNSYPEKEIADIIWKYGEERHSRRIARAIVRARMRKGIGTCRELSEIIVKAVGWRGRIHPATRTFQALRIAVNSELDELQEALTAGAGILDARGRFCVMSYHSLEDRIVKHTFRAMVREGGFASLTKKPVRPGEEEKRVNPSSRSARLRAIERLQ